MSYQHQAFELQEEEKERRGGLTEKEQKKKGLTRPSGINRLRLPAQITVIIHVTLLNGQHGARVVYQCQLPITLIAITTNVGAAADAANEVSYYVSYSVMAVSRENKKYQRKCLADG